MNPAVEIDPRVARRDDQRDEDPDDARSAEEAEVGQAIARFHHEKV